MTRRVMNGVALLTGQHVNTLLVGEMVSRHPSPRYEVTCERCGTRSTAGQAQITNRVARCLSGNCGKAHIQEHLTDTPSKARRRAEEQEAARLRERQEQEAAELTATEEEFKRLQRDIGLTVRARILTGKDDEFVIDPATFTPIPAGTSVDDWHRKESAKFLQENPDYFPCEENLQAIKGYIDRNAPKIRLVSAIQLEGAFKRLREYGLLKQRPIPEPAPRPAPVKVNLTITPSVAPSGPASESRKGFDPETGLEREYTPREIDKMSADQFRRIFRIYRDELTLPNVGPGARRQL
jgi:hypothetical protein